MSCGKLLTAEERRCCFFYGFFYGCCLHSYPLLPKSWVESASPLPAAIIHPLQCLEAGTHRSLSVADQRTVTCILSVLIQAPGHQFMVMLGIALRVKNPFNRLGTVVNFDRAVLVLSDHVFPFWEHAP